MFKCQELSTKQFTPLWRSCEPHASLCKCGKCLKNRFQPPRKCYASRAGMFKCQEKPRKQFSLLWNLSTVDLVQPCVCAGGALKHVQACLSAKKDQESSFHYCGGPVKLVQACL